jgi:hypothetical protein
LPALSAHGILLGSIETAKHPALVAATGSDAESEALYGSCGSEELSDSSFVTA